MLNPSRPRKILLVQATIDAYPYQHKPSCYSLLIWDTWTIGFSFLNKPTFTCLSSVQSYSPINIYNTHNSIYEIIEMHSFFKTILESFGLGSLGVKMERKCFSCTLECSKNPGVTISHKLPFVMVTMTSHQKSVGFVV